MVVAIRSRPYDVLLSKTVAMHHVQRSQAVLVVAGAAERGLQLHVEAAARIARSAEELAAAEGVLLEVFETEGAGLEVAEVTLIFQVWLFGFVLFLMNVCSYIHRFAPLPPNPPWHLPLAINIRSDHAHLVDELVHILHSRLLAVHSVEFLPSQGACKHAAHVEFAHLLEVVGYLAQGLLVLVVVGGRD